MNLRHDQTIDGSHQRVVVPFLQLGQQKYAVQAEHAGRSLPLDQKPCATHVCLVKRFLQPGQSGSENQRFSAGHICDQTREHPFPTAHASGFSYGNQTVRATQRRCVASFSGAKSLSQSKKPTPRFLTRDQSLGTTHRQSVAAFVESTPTRRTQ